MILIGSLLLNASARLDLIGGNLWSRGLDRVALKTGAKL
jgi:hypothetical protein